jgi:hypothetical protein
VAEEGSTRYEDDLTRVERRKTQGTVLASSDFKLQGYRQTGLGRWKGFRSYYGDLTFPASRKTK